MHFCRAVHVTWRRRRCVFSPYKLLIIADFKFCNEFFWGKSLLLCHKLLLLLSFWKNIKVNNIIFESEEYLEMGVYAHGCRHYGILWG